MSYPLLSRHGQFLRSTFMRCYLRANRQRRIREGLYYPGPPVTVRTAAEGVETHYQQVSDFLTSITTPVGAYVVRRLPEAPPYY